MGLDALANGWAGSMDAIMVWAGMHWPMDGVAALALSWFEHGYMDGLLAWTLSWFGHGFGPERQKECGKRG